MSVVPLTLQQNTPEWFLLHTFSFTSSTTDQLLSEIKKVALDAKTFFLIDDETKGALKAVLDVVHGEGWDHDAPTHPLTPPTCPEVEAQEEMIVMSNCADIDSQIKLLMQ